MNWIVIKVWNDTDRYLLAYKLDFIWVHCRIDLITDYHYFINGINFFKFYKNFLSRVFLLNTQKYPFVDKKC
jgi:hypothetical protein